MPTSESSEVSSALELLEIRGCCWLLCGRREEHQAGIRGSTAVMGRVCEDGEGSVGVDTTTGRSTRGITNAAADRKVDGVIEVESMLFPPDVR